LKRVIAELKCLQYYRMHYKIGIVTFEGIREKGNSDILPFNNVFVRADSGKIGKVKVNIFGSKRDIMPIYASESPRQSALGADDTVDHGFLKNSLQISSDWSGEPSLTRIISK